jgi:hypothetical protein
MTIVTWIYTYYFTKNKYAELFLIFNEVIKSYLLEQARGKVCQTECYKILYFYFIKFHKFIQLSESTLLTFRQLFTSEVVNLYKKEEETPQVIEFVPMMLSLYLKNENCENKKEISELLEFCEKNLEHYKFGYKLDVEDLEKDGIVCKLQDLKKDGIEPEGYDEMLKEY